jgi:plastocyanin
MFLSRGEIVGFIIAILIVAVMGVITFTGPYHKFNTVQAKSPYKPLEAVILPAPGKYIGKYQPATATVHVGQLVTFTNNSNAAHTVTAQNGAFDSQNIAIGSSWGFTPTKPGTYHYYCIYHTYMHGTLIVKK